MTAYTPPQVAEKYGVKPETVRSWIASGELEAVNLASPKSTRSRWRVMPDALERFLAGRSNHKPEAAKPRRRRKKKLKLAFLK